MLALFSIEKCASDEAYSTGRAGRPHSPPRVLSGTLAARAILIPVVFASEPPGVRLPNASAGYPARSHSHRMTVRSTAVAAGLWCHAPTFWLSAAPSASANTAIG